MILTLVVPDDLRQKAWRDLIPDTVTIEVRDSAVGGCIVSASYGDCTCVNEGERVAVTLLLRRVQQLEAELAERVSA